MSEEVQYNRAIDIPGLILSSARFADFCFEPHYHLDFHIGLVANGVQRQLFQGESLMLSRGAIQLMPPGEVHNGVSGSDASYTLHTFRLSPELLNVFGEEITGKHLFPSQAAVVLQDNNLANTLLQMHSTLRHAPTDPLLNATRAMDLFEFLFAQILQPSPQRITGGLSPKQLRCIRDFMDAHLCDKIVLEDLAFLIGLDRFRFLKLFKRTVGMTPHAWLLRLRLEKSVALIKRNSGMSILDIAHAVGFFDQSHFTRAFQHAYGVTPARF